MTVDATQQQQWELFSCSLIGWEYILIVPIAQFLQWSTFWKVMKQVGANSWRKFIRESLFVRLVLEITPTVGVIYFTHKKLFLCISNT